MPVLIFPNASWLLDARINRYCFGSCGPHYRHVKYSGSDWEKTEYIKRETHKLNTKKHLCDTINKIFAKKRRLNPWI